MQLQDLRYGWRQLWRAPGFTLTVVLTLALGIGANTAIFSLFNALVLRLIPGKDPAAMVNLYRTTENAARFGVFSYPEYRDYREHNTVLSGLAAFTGARVTLATGNGSGDGPGESGDTLQALLVSGNYFSVLGLGAAQGRTFLPEEDDTPNARAVVVLSHDLWRRRLGGDPTLVGGTLKLNDVRYTVVGIAPEGFGGTTPDPVDMWIPMMMQGNVRPGSNLLEDRGYFSLQLIGRLKPGVSREQAQAEMTVLARQVTQVQDAKTANISVTVTRAGFLNPQELDDVVPLAALSMASVALVLLIACANVANLLLARGAGRQKELGIRSSLGASRGRLIRQLLTESMLLALAGGLCGTLLALWLAQLLLAFVHPPGLQQLKLQAPLDVRVLGFSLLLSLLTGLLCGWLPALRSSKQEVVSAVKEEWSAFGQRVSKSRLRGFLVISQVAISLVLLVGAGLLARALRKAQQVTPGFQIQNVTVVSANLPQRNYSAARALEFERELTERLFSVPGVAAVGLARTAPLGSSFAVTVIAAPGAEGAGRTEKVNFNTVTPGYFEALGIPLVRGRNFTQMDISNRARVAVVSEAFARHYWPGEDPIGKRFNGGGASAYREVIGVAQDVRNVYLWSGHEPYLYLPLTAAEATDMLFFVRTQRNNSALAGAIPGYVHALDASVQVSAQRLDENLALWIWPSQMGALLSAALGLFALLLAAAGIYAVMAYAVTQRTREIGIRMALGSQQQEVMELLLREGMGLVGLGLVIGLLVSLGGARLLAKFLYGLSAVDGLAFGGVSLLLTGVALLACWLPARRAMRVEPMVALRYE
jgi:putative ABC transport system permease protein